MNALNVFGGLLLLLVVSAPAAAEEGYVLAGVPADSGIVWTYPPQDGWLCLNKREPLRVIRRNICGPFNLKIMEVPPKGATRVLGTPVTEPWVVEATFTKIGPTTLKAEYCDGYGSVSVRVTVENCIDRYRFNLLAQQIRACPSCSKLAPRLGALERQVGKGTAGIRPLPFIVKELESLEMEVKALQGRK